ncbi:hypothetical protein DW876_23455 [Hungatella hathewayi]|nr:hypothetical protein DW876_23455 [Hungatella hathewayi]
MRCPPGKPVSRMTGAGFEGLWSRRRECREKTVKETDKCWPGGQDLPLSFTVFLCNWKVFLLHRVKPLTKWAIAR